MSENIITSPKSVRFHMHQSQSEIPMSTLRIEVQTAPNNDTSLTDEEREDSDQQMVEQLAKLNAENDEKKLQLNSPEPNDVVLSPNNIEPRNAANSTTNGLHHLSFIAPEVDFTTIENLPPHVKQLFLVKTPEEMKSVQQQLSRMSSEEKQQVIDGIAIAALPALLKVADWHGFTERNATIAWRNLYYAKGGIMRLQGVSGFLHPGMLLCVLGSNDSGITTFFDVVNGRQKGGKFSGELLINGKPPDASWNRIVGYVSKEDIHLPTLTVLETLFFSARLRSPGNVSDAQLYTKIGVVLKMLGLAHVANSIVGDGLLRGISGGERRRLSYACELVAGHSVIIADLPTNGLDSASAFSLIQHAKHAAIAGHSFMCSLVQPAPELLQLFDFVQLMSKGSCIYFGPPSYAQTYLENIGFQRPLGKSLPDFLEELSAHPEKFFKLGEIPHSSLKFVTYEARMLKKRHRPTTRKSKGEPVQIGTVSGQWGTANKGKVNDAEIYFTGEAESDALLKAEEDRIKEMPTRAKVWLHLRNSYKSSSLYNELGLVHWNLLEPVPQFIREPEQKPAALSQKNVDICTAIFMFLSLIVPYLSVLTNYNSSFFLQLKLTFTRQFHVTIRDKSLVATTIGKSVIIGLLLGTLFYNLGSGQQDVRTRFGLFFFCLMFLMTGQIAFVPTVMRYRTLYYIQSSADYFHGITYYLAFAVLDIPIAAIESFIFTLIVYGLSGLQDNVFSNKYGYFFIVVCLIDLIARAWVFLICNISPNQTVAATLTPVTVLVLSIFAGYLNPKDSIPTGWKWMYDISPMTYGFKGLCINEMFDMTFHCSAADYLPPNPVDTNFQLTCQYNSGRQALASYDMDPGAGNGNSEKWTMCTNLVYFYLTFHLAAMVALIYVDWSAQDSSPAPQWTGQRIKHGQNNEQQDNKVDDHEVVMTIASSESKKILKSRPVTLEWKLLNYSVQLADKTNRLLLKEVFGYSEPGKMTALMGASGAGKSTLLDVLSGMKTSGHIEGDILVNGQPKDTKTWSSIAGYVEQFDSHHPSSTVREAILFSSRLRLAKDLSEAEKQRRVDAIIEVLQLGPFENSIIGSPDTGGISPDIRKKVTIAVEMVMQPSILFLDEPTTGLESSGAVSVMTCVKKLCEDLGMSVLCTIHQPSAEIIALFDSLLLLKPGGEVSYFGPLEEVSPYCKYIGYTECPPEKNIADHVMEIIKKATTKQHEDKTALNLRTAYLEHPIGKAAIERLFEKSVSESAKQVNEQENIASLIYEREGFIGQFLQLFYRFALTNIRGIAALRVRMSIPIMTGLLFGTLFYQLGSGQKDASNRISMIFMSVSLPVFSAAAVLPDIFDARPVFFREQKANMYSGTAYFLARTLADIPLQWLESFIYSVIAYWMCGLTSESSGTHFALFFLCYWFTRMAGIGLAHLVGTTSAASEQANGMHQSLATVMMLFAGFLISKGNIPSGWIWMYYLSLFHYSMGFLIPNEMNNLTFECSGSTNIFLPKYPSLNPNITLTEADCAQQPQTNTTCYLQYCPIQTGAQLMSEFDIDSSQKNQDLGIVVAFVGCFFVLAWWALLKINFIKR